jgi:hypothetical protein
MNTQPDDFGKAPPIQEINPFQKFPIGGMGFGAEVDKDLRASVEQVPEQIKLTNRDHTDLVPEPGDNVEELMPEEAQLQDPLTPPSSPKADRVSNTEK